MHNQPKLQTYVIQRHHNGIGYTETIDCFMTRVANEIQTMDVRIVNVHYKEPGAFVITYQEIRK